MSSAIVLMLDRAMREYRIGLSKPYLTAYQLVKLREQLAALPPCRQMEDYLLKVDIGSKVLYPELARWRDLARVTSFYAKTLIVEGRMQEATPYLEVTAAFHQADHHWIGDIKSYFRGGYHCQRKR